MAPILHRILLISIIISDHSLQYSTDTLSLRVQSFHAKEETPPYYNFVINSKISTKVSSMVLHIVDYIST